MIKNLSADMQELIIKLTELVNSLSEKIDKKNIDLLNEFIENRESGVAIEWLYSLIKERSIKISQEQQDVINRAAKMMNITLI